MVFLGLLFPMDQEKSIIENSKNASAQNQVNGFQWACINGLYDNLKSGITIVNSLPVGAYPKNYKKAFLPYKKWSYRSETHYQMSTVNLPVLKQLDRKIQCRKLLKSIDDDRILIYSTYLPYLKAIKRFDKSKKITLIVTDLPEYYDSTQCNRLHRALRRINNRMIYSCLQRVDSFVLLTDQMKEVLRVGSRPYTVMEGIYAATERPETEPENKAEKTVFYSGSLNEQFGIRTLLDAFEMISDPEYRLIICGAGDLSDEIAALSKKETRVEYKGFVPRETALKLQRTSAVLVNPRQNNGEYTKYSFPSKTMEYLASGTPVIAYELSGIPHEYSSYINYAAEGAAENLKEKIIEICETHRSEADKRAADAKKFIISKKTPAVQTERIIELMGR